MTRTIFGPSLSKSDIMISYRLPAKNKSTIHEKLFGRKHPKKKKGILSRYVTHQSHGTMWTRKRHLDDVKRILRANNAEFTIGPRPTKHASYLRQQRRLRAAWLSDFKRSIRIWKSERAVLKHVPDAKSDIRWLNRRIEEDEQALKKLRARQNADWEVAYCKGKASAYVMRRRRAYVHRESLNTVVKALRSILKWGVITRRDIESQLEKITDEITESEEAVRLTRLTSRLGFDAHWVKQRAQVRLQKFGIAY